MNQHAIDRDHTQTRGMGAVTPHQRRGICRASTFNHHEFQSARKTTSLVRRNLGRRFGVGHFIRLGWSFTTDREFSEADCLVKAGVDSRVAAQLIANHSAAPGSIQGISERLPFHLSKSLSQHRGNPTGIPKECQQGMPKNWESLPKRGSE